MSSVLPVSETRDMLIAVCDGVIREKQRLTLLDGPIGDGDHGIGMSRGMKKAKTVLLKEDSPEDVNGLFYKMGRALISTMGGSSGVIFGMMFMGAVSGMDKTDRLDGCTFARMMRNALEAVKEKGKSQPGEKTMVDALEPAVVAMELSDNDDLAELLDLAVKASEEGAAATRNMISKHGHSKTLGKRALGHMDPGSVSVGIIFQAMQEYLVKRYQVPLTDC